MRTTVMWVFAFIKRDSFASNATLKSTLTNGENDQSNITTILYNRIIVTGCFPFFYIFFNRRSFIRARRSQL